MRYGAATAVIIPALNESKAIGHVLSAIPEWVDDIVVIDNGSTDDTAVVARNHGARVFTELRRGYGSACLAGIRQLSDPDLVVFMDGDYSDYPEEAALLVDPIISGKADLVIGSRVQGNRKPGALTPQAIFGNWLACRLMQFFWKKRFTDLGPFRAISVPALDRLEMRDPNYGWTVEMQIKAVKCGLHVEEVPVSYRRRIGKSKVSGTVRGVWGAGTKILGTILRAAIGMLPVTKTRGEQVIVFGRNGHPDTVTDSEQPIERTLIELEAFASRRGATVEVRYGAFAPVALRDWTSRGISCREQGPGDLGRRLHRAFKDAFRSGVDRALVVRSDAPGVGANLLEAAIDALSRFDVVCGSARGGGYSYIGLKRLCPPLFSSVNWEGDGVLEDLEEIARFHHFSVKLLEPPNGTVKRNEKSV